jgi:hypothetical protein
MSSAGSIQVIFPDAKLPILGHAIGWNWKLISAGSIPVIFRDAKGDSVNLEII